MSNYILTADGHLYHCDATGDELYHYVVKGMKWGKRMARGHAGPGRYATVKRQLAGDKRDLEGLNNGQHLSVGLTKKRQAVYDARDKARLEKRITKNEAILAARDKAKAHDAKTAARDKARQAKVKTTVNKYMASAKAHEAVTAARDKARQEKVQSAVKKYLESAQAHEAKTAARDKARQEKVKTVIGKNRK